MEFNHLGHPPADCMIYSRILRMHIPTQIFIRTPNIQDGWWMGNLNDIVSSNRNSKHLFVLARLQAGIVALGLFVSV